MPKVPTYDSYQVTPNTLPQTYAKLPDFPLDPGATGKVMGEALTGAGNALSKVAIDMAQEANQTRLDEAALRLREQGRTYQYGKSDPNNPNSPNNITGYAQLKGEAALNTPDGTSLADHYGQKLQDSANQIAEGLGNDAQKMAFKKYADGYIGGYKDNVWQHAMREQTTWRMSVAEGLHDEAVTNLKTNYRNPLAVDQAIATIGQQSHNLGRLKGLSDPEINQARLKSVSSALKTAVEAYQADGDAMGAAAFYEKYKHQITMDDALVVSKQVKTGVDTYVGLTAGQSAFNQAKQPAAAQVAFNAMNATAKEVFNKGVVQTESSNAPGVVTHLNKDGTTDYGPGQLNEKTGPEAAKLAGVAWDLEKLKTDPNYGHALSLALFQDKYTKNGNDLSKAIADYHAPKRTQDAIKEAKKTGGNWLDYVDDELRTYVNKTVENYNRAASKPPKEMTMADVEARLSTMKLSPEQLVKARAEGEYHLKNYNAQIKAQVEGSITNALDAAKQNNVPFEKLPLAIQNAIPSDKIGEVKDKIKKILDTGDVNTDWNKYAEITAQATNPNTRADFAKRDLRNDFPYLGNEQRKQLVDMQNDLNNPDKAPEIASLSGQIAQYGARYKGNAEQQAKFASAIQSAVSQEIRAKGGRPLSFEEREVLIKRMLLPVNLGMWSTNKAQWETLGTVDEGKGKIEISDDDRAQITKALENEGKKINEQNIRDRFNLKYGIS